MPIRERYLSRGPKVQSLDLLPSKPVIVIDPLSRAVEKLRRDNPDDPKGKYNPGTTIKEQLEHKLTEGKLKFLGQEQTIPDFDVSIKKDNTWAKQSIYTLFVDEQDNNRITGLLGMDIEIEQWINIPHGYKRIRVGRITQEMYDLITYGLNSTEVLMFWDHGSVKYYRIMLDVDLTTTTYDVKKKTLISIDNVIRFKVKLLDQDNKPIDNCKQLSVKIMKQRRTGFTNPAEFVGKPNKKITINQDELIEVRLIGEGRHIIRAKALINDVSRRWLTCFPECTKLDEEELAELKRNIADIGVPSQMIPIGEKNT